MQVRRPSRVAAATAERPDEAVDPAWTAYAVLHLGFVALPIVAGLDKFFNLLADWRAYLAPAFHESLGVSATTFMYAVGAVEVLAGFLVAFAPRVGGYVVMLWLWAIITNLIVLGDHWDIALRDVGLSIGAYALARLATGVRSGSRAISAP